MLSQARTEIVESAVGMSGAPSWRIDTLVTDDDLLALEPEWRRLEPGMSPLPFVCFDWIVPWWQHFRSRGGVVRDDLFICAFRTAAGELIGVAPLMLTQRPSVGPLRYRQLQFFGADRNITEVRCMATAPENMEALYSALLDHLRQFQRQWNATSLTGLPGGSAALEARINGTYVSRFWDADTANPILDLKPSWEEFKSGLPRNIRESLRKCYNAPRRDGLSFEFRVLSAAADVHTAVHRFIELHRARSEMPSLVNHADTFASRRSQEFLLDVSRRFAERDALRIFELRHNDSVIAIRIGFVRQDTLYLYYSGFDPTYRRYSVMTRLVAEAIKYAIVSGFRALNLSTGRDFSKTRWAPREMVYRNVEFSSPTRIDSLKHRGFRTFFNYVQHRSPHGWVARALSRGH